MSDDNKNRDEDRGGKKNGEFRVPPRTYIIWIAILGAIPLLMPAPNLLRCGIVACESTIVNVPAVSIVPTHLQI